jgi:hypothetical protein
MSEAGERGDEARPEATTPATDETARRDNDERMDWARWQATRWARRGQLHPTSVAVAAQTDAVVGDLLYWSSFGLDASVELDDLVQMLALAQLEAQTAHGEAGEPALRGEVQRRLRRAAWRVRLARGAHYRTEWKPKYLDDLAGPDGGLAAVEDLTWDDLVRKLGWCLGLAVWLTTVEQWSLDEVGEVTALTKQQVWRRQRRGLARLRAELAPALPKRSPTPAPRRPRRGSEGSARPRRSRAPRREGS